MNQYTRQAENHITKMIQQLCVTNNFQKMFLQCAMISHQTDDMNALQQYGHRTK